MIDGRLIFLMFIGMAIFAVAWSIFMFNQCISDGYNRTQCLMMLQADNTSNMNVFGVTPPQKEP